MRADSPDTVWAMGQWKDAYFLSWIYRYPISRHTPLVRFIFKDAESGAVRLCVERPVALTVPVPPLPDSNLEAELNPCHGFGFSRFEMQGTSSWTWISLWACQNHNSCYLGRNLLLKLLMPWSLKLVREGILQISVCDLGLQLWTSGTCAASGCIWNGQRAKPLTNTCRGGSWMEPGWNMKRTVHMPLGDVATWRWGV